MEITKKSFLVSADGGVLDCEGPGGEILFSVAVPAGKVRAAQYLDLVPHGAVLVVGAGLSVIDPPSGLGHQPYGDGALETGANPDFQPSSADFFQRQMRHQMAQLQAKSKALDKRMAQLAKIEPAAVVKDKPADPSVIEDDVAKPVGDAK